MLSRKTEDDYIARGKQVTKSIKYYGLQTWKVLTRLMLNYAHQRNYGPS